MKLEKSSSEVSPASHIVLTERGHHLQHILDVAFKYRSFHFDPNTPNRYGTDQVRGQHDEYLEHKNLKEDLEKIRDLFIELQELAWFKSFLAALIQNSFWGKAQLNRWEEDKTVDYTDIDVLFKYVLAYACNRVNSEWFKSLQNPCRWFDKTALKVLKDWNTDTSFIDEALSKYDDLQTIEYHDMAILVDFCLEVIDIKFRATLMPILSLGDPELFLKQLEGEIQYHAKQERYFSEIQVSDTSDPSFEATKNGHIRFASKVTKAIDSPDSRILLHSKIGEICTIFAQAEVSECARHCLRLQNARGDQYVLDLLHLFAQEHPEHRDKFEFHVENDKVVQVILDPAIFSDQDFMGIFDEFYSIRRK